MDYLSLKERQRAERERHSPNLAVRVHRALSWLKRAEQLKDDLDGRFISLWISFNAAYATEINENFRLSEQSTFRSFIGKLLDLDKNGLMERMVWQEFTGSIRLLLNNPYIFHDFWSSQNGSLGLDVWSDRFHLANEVAKKALGHRKTDVVLSIVLSRIYTLRNQIIHGGATWGSKVNRDQLSDCSKLLEKFVPNVILIMLDNPESVWDQVVYPVIDTINT